MLQKFFISIILPTYNRSILLKRCVESVKSQTYSDWELIISDDCSTDESQTIIRRLATSDDRIRYNFNESNEGLPKNRNIAMKMLKGNIVFFIEDDLILTNNCLKVLIDTYKDLQDIYKVGSVAPRLLERYTFKYNKQKMDKLSKPFMFDRWTGEVHTNYTEDFGEVQEVVTVHSCSLYSLNALREVRGFEENAYTGTYGREESDLNFRMAKKGYKFFFQPKAIAYHKHVHFGGCFLPQPQRGYYYIKNHIVFVTRIFGIKSFYMIPLFLINTLFKSSHVLLNSKQKNIY